MESYAIVIGIDGYDPAIGTLDGAVRDALDFAAWVTGPGGVPAANLRLLLGPDPAAPPPVLPDGVAGFAPASSLRIREEIEALREAMPADGGERLYFYYAGHGASIPEWQEDPFLIPPEFVRPKLHGPFLLGFKDLFQSLGELPFAEQICLIDACRDFGLAGYEPVIPSGVRRRLIERKALQYVLYSVAPGQKAAETGQGIWTRTLLDGLTGHDYRPVTRGTGREGRYEVRLDDLADWVRDEVARRIQKKFLRDAARYVQTPQYDRDKDGGDPLMVTFTSETVPKARLRVFVDPDLAHPTCRVSVMQYVDGLGEEIKVTSSPPPPLRVPVQFELRPSDYSIRAEAELFTMASRAWTVFDDPTVRLALEEMPNLPDNARSRSLDDFKLPGTLSAGDDNIKLPGTLPVWDPEATRRTVREEPLSFGVAPTRSSDSGRLIVISQAAAWIEVLDARRKVVQGGLGSFEVGLQPGIYRVRLHLPGAEPSEETVEVRPGARVEYVGGTRAEVRLASRLSFSCADQPPDRRFSGGPGSAVLLLMGASGNRTPEELGRFLAECRVSLRRSGGPVVGEGGLEPLPGWGAAGRRAIRVDGSGPLTAELHMPGVAPARYATATRPGRLTVLVAVAEADGTVEVQQTILLPPGRSTKREVEAGLRRMRTWGLAQACYAAGDPDLALAVSGRKPEELLRNPLLGCLAGYSLIQTGDRAEWFAGEVLPGLLREFPDLPDVQILAGDFAKALELGLPLFAQGLRVLAERSPERPPHLAEALASLLPGSPWTAWLARAPW